MSYAGERLYDELKNTDISVIYGIDKNADNIYAAIPVIKPEDKLEKTDAIVVTTISYFENIKKLLSEKIDCPIYSLEEMFYD